MAICNMSTGTLGQYYKTSTSSKRVQTKFLDRINGVLRSDLSPAGVQGSCSSSCQALAASMLYIIDIQPNSMHGRVSHVPFEEQWRDDEREYVYLPSIVLKHKVIVVGRAASGWVLIATVSHCLSQNEVSASRDV